MKYKVDNIKASGKWKFDKEVTEVFENMLSRSIPDILNLRNTVTKLIVRYAKTGTTVLDLGCSQGGAIKKSLELIRQDVKFLGVEVSPSMRTFAKKNLEKYIKTGKVEIINCDLKTDFPDTKNTVVLSVLTLQFIPIEYRQAIVAKVFNSLESGGIFILVEKILGDNSPGNQLLENLYYDLKGRNGYTQEEILKKRKSLEGVLVPVTSQWNEELMHQAGFKYVQKFWQQLNFSGWVALK